MLRPFRFVFIVLALITVAVQARLPQMSVSPSPAPTIKLSGRWQVKLLLPGPMQKNLIFDSKTNGTGLFHLLDTGPDDKPVPASQPAVWSQTTNERVSLSGEVELPLGTCCREVGTLMLKGKFESSNSISGKLVFVTSIDEDESPYKFRSMLGTFTATRLPDHP